jgi:hypothetical protein
VRWGRTIFPPGTCEFEQKERGRWRQDTKEKEAIRVAQEAAAAAPAAAAPALFMQIVNPSDAAAAALRKVRCPPANGRRPPPIFFDAAAAHALLSVGNDDADLLAHAASVVDPLSEGGEAFVARVG